MPNSYELSQEKTTALETFDTVDYYLNESFNLDDFGATLRKQHTTTIRFESFERQLPFPKMPDFKPSFYGGQRRGIVPSQLDRLEVANGKVAYDKREDTHAGSNNYKIHGALFSVLHTLNEQPESRIMSTASAGNHGISLAMAVNLLNQQLDGSMQREAHIYCREDISPVKKALLQKLGATVFARYETLEEAMATVEHLDEQDANYAFIHPFDDALTIAGQATIEFETFAALKSGGVDLRNTTFRRYIPVGGGGYLAGTAYAWNLLRQWGVLSDDSQLIGVEVENNDSMARALDERPPLVPHGPETPDGANTLDTDSDGTATLRPGKNTLPIARLYTNGIRVIPKEHLVRACGVLASNRDGQAPELAGSLSMGGLLYDIDQQDESGRAADYNLTTTTGRNIAPALLRRLSQEWLDNPCDIRTKIAALALKTAGERAASDSTKQIPVPRYEELTQRRSSVPAATKLRVWNGYAQR